MASIMTDFGEEYYHRTGTGDLSEISTWEVGIYDDSTDNIAEGDDVGAIDTEPGNTNYSRQSITASNVTFAQSGGDIENDVPDVTFDLSDNSSSNTVDSWFVVIEYQATTVSSDGSATAHLVLTGDLSQEYTLSNVDNLQVQNVGFSLS